MKKQVVKRYSEAFKRQVVNEYEAGQSVAALQRKYGIKGGETIPAWIRKYAHAGLRHELVVIQRADERDAVQELQAENSQLKDTLAQTAVEKRALQVENIALASELAETKRLLAALGKKQTAPSSSNGASDTR